MKPVYVAIHISQGEVTSIRARRQWVNVREMLEEMFLQAGIEDYEIHDGDDIDGYNGLLMTISDKHPDGDSFELLDVEIDDEEDGDE